MRLGKNKLQDLKNGKIQMEELDFRYFVNSETSIEFENISKLLTESICSVADIFKSIMFCKRLIT